MDSTSSQDFSDNDENDKVDEGVQEPWPEFLKRTARWIAEQLEVAGQNEWLTIWRTRQWRWAHKLVTHDEGKWSATATHWNPLLHSGAPRRRAQARPRKRCVQDIVDFLGTKIHNSEPWMLLAKGEEAWMRNANDFIEHTAL